jgi:fucose permease
LRSVVVVGLGLLVFMVYTGLEASAGQWAASFDRGPLHLGAGATGLSTFGYWGALTLVRFGLAAPRRKLSPVAVVRWGCGTALVGAGLVWWRPTTVVALVGLVVIGGALAGVYPALVALTPSRVGEEMVAHVIGWQVGAAYLGGAGLSAVFGVVFQHFGLLNFGPALVVVAAILIIGSVALEVAAPAKALR